MEAYASGRNDILVGGKKISGSAFKEIKGRSFHHGTLLIDTDLTKLGRYLVPREKKLASKGIRSVRSRVMNLKEEAPLISHDLICKAIIEEFSKKYGQSCEVETLDLNFLSHQPSFMKSYEKLKDWHWRIGETPKFEQSFDEQFSFGSMEVFLNSHKGVITEIKIFSDGLHPEMIEYLNRAFLGISYHPEAVGLACDNIAQELPMFKDYIEEFRSWFCSCLS